MLNNRDISWLGFNYRILQEASDETVALFERMKFLSIFSSNLDEFFRVRYPSVIALSRLKEKTKLKAGVEVEENILTKIKDEIIRQLDLFGKILTGQVIPELKKNKIIFYYNTPVRPEHATEIKEYFFSHILAFLQPIILDDKDPYVFAPENNQLYFIVTLKTPGDDILKHAIVNIPSNKTKRFFVLTLLEGNDYVIFLDDIIRENLHYLFPEMQVQAIYSIKFNRDAELNLTDEYSGNLLEKIERQLKKRVVALTSRFLYEAAMPRNLQLFLAAAFDIQYEDMFAGGRYHNLSDLSGFPTFGKKLYFEKLESLAPAGIKDSGDIFKILNEQDVLLHLPYQSYNPVLSFFNQAAVDATVTDIYITLYRLASESLIVNALINAAKNGKNVVVIIELKARFDEANNIKWSRIMKDAGITLIYSMPQIKVHSKIALVKKKIKGEELSYAVISTGNFNEITAVFYTDHVLMTSNKKIIHELSALLKFLEKGHNEIGDTKIKFEELLVSQFNLKEELEKYIHKEIKAAKNNIPARIRIKVNNLEEPGIIDLLYKASKAGVRVELIVRSVCCILPGIAGLSENIIVHRIVDRFLEHSRVFIFGEDDHASVFLGSADLMTRNLFHRIEVCVAVKDDKSKKELLDYFGLQWNDYDKFTLRDNDQPAITQSIANGCHKKAQENIYQYLKQRI